MLPVEYVFDRIHKNIYNYHRDYILRIVKKGKLTDIYHTHDFYEIIIVLQGGCTAFINGHEYDLNMDSIVIMCPGDSHSFLKQTEDVGLLSLSVRVEEFERIAGALGWSVQDTSQKEELPYIWKVEGIYRNITVRCNEILGSCREYDCKLFLAYLIRLYIGFKDDYGMDLPAILIWALKEMQRPENLQDGISALEKLSGYSRSQLTRLIKRQFGVTVHEYIQEQRLLAAYNEVVLTSEDLVEISEKIGYSSFSHFNKIFKERFGITPALLRKKNSLRTV